MTYYTGNFRLWYARPLIAEASLCPAITRTPSSIRATTLSAVQACRKAMPFLRQARQDAVARPLHFRWVRLIWNREITKRKTQVAWADLGKSQPWHREDRLAIGDAFGAFQLYPQ